MTPVLLACLALANAATAQTPAPAAPVAEGQTNTPPPARRGRITPPGPPVRMTPAVTLPFIEDFESGAINTNIWDVRTNGAATVKITQDHVAHGKNALWVHYPAGANHAWSFIAAHLPDSLHDHLYGRAYMYVTSLPASHNPLLLAGTPGFPISNFLEVGSQSKQFKPSFQQNGAGVTRGEITAQQGDVPLQRWFCLEWELNDKPDRIILTVDGKQVADKSFTFGGAGSELVKGFSEFDIGFRTWAAATLVPNDIDIYYDDIEISDKPIGQLTPVPAN